ncbi:hypothetical protein Tco_1111739 [Tanacetum coccineum]|uniref:Uncharacterized protein n=1 Tax=Tanacetum coccineum TaxID=301880 RepID=A0ABQ5INR7_9ASTR
MSSRVSNKDVHLGEHRKQKPFLKFNDLQCPTCKKCLYSANHDECVLEYLSRLNPRASAQNKDAKSHKTTKRYMPVEKSSASKKPERQIPTGHRFSHKKTTTVPEKTRTPRSCLRWQPTGRILKTVCLRPRSSMFKRRLIAADQASVFMIMTSDHNRSELGIQDHSNEQSSSKLVPKVVPVPKKLISSYITTKVGITNSHLHIAMLRTTGLPSCYQESYENIIVYLPDTIRVEVHKLLSRVLRNIIVIFARTSE